MGVEGWIRPDRLLIHTSGHLLTWNPTTGDLIKIANVPKSDRDGRFGAVYVQFPPMPFR